MSRARFRPGSIDLARLRPEVERLCGPLGGGSTSREVAGRALEALVLHDYAGWSMALAAERIGYSASHTSWLLREWRDELIPAAERIVAEIS